jgi:hypothetical protein
MFTSKIFITKLFLFMTLVFQEQNAVSGFNTIALQRQLTKTGLHAIDGRRSFLDASFVAMASTLILSQPALAEGDSVDDLSMPTEEEVKKAEVCLVVFRFTPPFYPRFFDSFAKRWCFYLQSPLCNF